MADVEAKAVRVSSVFDFREGINILAETCLTEQTLVSRYKFTEC